MIAANTPGAQADTVIRATRKRLTLIAAGKMQKAMESKPRSLMDLVKVSGLSKTMVTNYVRDLRDEDLVHVGDWAKDRRGYPTIKKYSWGKGIDAECPRKTITPAERMRALRAARKGEVVADDTLKSDGIEDTLALQKLWSKK